MRHLTKFYSSWKNNLRKELEHLYNSKFKENEKNKKTKEIIENYIITNKKNRFIDIKPIIYLYETYYDSYYEKIKFKICDIKINFNFYKDIEKLKLRDEIKFKMTLKSYISNIKNMEEIFGENEKKIITSIEFESTLKKYYEIKKKFTDFFNKKINKNNRKHDAIITLELNGNYSEIACEFNEYHHKREYDKYREDMTKLIADDLLCCKEYNSKNILYFMKKLNEIIFYQICLLSDNHILVAKFLLNNECEQNNVNYEKISLMVDCLEKKKFNFDEIKFLYQIDSLEQENFKNLLLKNNILTKKNDKIKVKYEKDDDGIYYLTFDEFKKFSRIIIKKEISPCSNEILDIWQNGICALMEASKKVISYGKKNKINTPEAIFNCSFEFIEPLIKSQ